MISIGQCFSTFLHSMVRCRGRLNLGLPKQCTVMCLPFLDWLLEKFYCRPGLTQTHVNSLCIHHTCTTQFSIEAYAYADFNYHKRKTSQLHNPIRGDVGNHYQRRLLKYKGRRWARLKILIYL